MSIKLKITAIVIACILTLSAIAGGIIAIVLNEKNEGEASTNSARLFTTNLFSSGSTVNAVNATILTRLFEDSANVLDWQQLCALNGGNPIIFPMGTYPNTNVQIYWEVVYKNSDIVTIWMCQPCESISYGKTVEDSGSIFPPDVLDTLSLPNIIDTARPGNGMTQAQAEFLNQYSPDYIYYDGGISNYSSSYVRAYIMGVYCALVEIFPLIDSLIVSPEYAENTLNYIPYQATQPNTYITEDFWSILNGLKENLDSGDGEINENTNLKGSEWENSTYQDKFWIPSYYEIYNSSTSLGGEFNGGYWNFSSLSDLGFDTPTDIIENDFTDEKYYNYAWLRSGTNYNTQNANYGLIISQGGEISIANCGDYFALRPAAHLSLNMLKSFVTKTVSTTATPAGAGTASGGQSNIIPNSRITLTATANDGYSFVGWSLDGGNTIIPDSIGKSDYTITVTQDATYTAVFEGGITITSANHREEFTILRESNDGITHSYLIQTIGANHLDRIAVIQRGTPNEEDYNKVFSIDGYISGKDYCAAIHYIINKTENTFVLEVYNATIPFVIYLDFR